MPQPESDTEDTQSQPSTPAESGPRMIRFPASTNIGAILYTPDTQQLQVEFSKSGAVYVYDQCPEDLAMGFQDALSATKYLETYIASQCPSTRIG